MKHMMMPHKEEIFQFCGYFLGFRPLCNVVSGPKNAQKGLHKVNSNFLYRSYFVLIFCVHGGRGWGGRATRSEYYTQLLYKYDVGTVQCLFCYCQEFCLATRIQPALKTHLLVSAFFLLLHDSFLRAFFWCATGHDPILSADMLSRTPSEPRIGLF